jgi:hypothetical protein
MDRLVNGTGGVTLPNRLILVGSPLAGDLSARYVLAVMIGARGPGVRAKVSSGVSAGRQRRA